MGLAGVVLIGEDEVRAVPHDAAPEADRQSSAA